MVSQTLFDLPSKNAAVFSPDARYRYTLRRQWDDAQPYCLFVMLNPSTADATQDDPTIRRCIGFAKNWGFGGLLVGNIFALRSTDPAALYHVDDPVGPENDYYLRMLRDEATLSVAAWGVHGAFGGRSKEVANQWGKALHCLGLTKDGHPRHPLYMPGKSVPLKWR